MAQRLSIEAELDGYKTLLRELARLSALFSESDKPALNYRSVEGAYAWATGSVDIGRKIVAFDAIHPDGFGVGIKTFVVEPSATYSFEKVAEFDEAAKAGRFGVASREELAKRIAKERNDRIAKAYDVSFMGDPTLVPKAGSSPIYHCVIRTTHSIFIQEFEYPFIDVDNIEILSKPGRTLEFSDGRHTYKWSSSKSTILMRFDLANPRANLKQYVSWPDRKELYSHILTPPGLAIPESARGKVEKDKVPGEDYWVLPFFTPSRDGISHKIAEASGINLCFASQKNRPRKMGESEVAVLQTLRNDFPDFLPYLGPGKTPSSKFILPSGIEVSGKRTGTNGKNLTFSDSRTGSHNQQVFTDWIYFEIDEKNKSKVENRWRRKKPYAYKDLLDSGVDSLVIEKGKEKGSYRLRLGELGSYDSFAELLDRS